MSALASLKLVAAKSSAKQSPVAQRRTKVLQHVDEQLALAAAQARGESYAATRIVVVRDKATGASSAQTTEVRHLWAKKGCFGLRFGIAV